MEATEPAIRPTTTGDLDAISQIYAHHVLTGVATFEVTPPDAQDWTQRHRAVVDGGLPFITAEVDGAVADYAYCAPWKSRPAYRNTVEVSIYLAPDEVGRGIGGRLLDALLIRCADAGVRQLVAVIVEPMPTLPLRCTVIEASSTRAGSSRSGSSTAAGWTRCCCSGASAELPRDVGERRVVVAVIRSVAAFAIDTHGSEPRVVWILVKR